MTEALITLFNRDLEKLKLEINTFNDEANLWKITGNVKNSAGNLCLHLIGNLNTYIGKNIGGTGYIRDRDAEFSMKNVPKQQLVQQVKATKLVVISALKGMHKDDVEHKYIENVLGYEMTTGFFLIHLNAHLSYHLGQVNYLRRILE